MDANSIPGDLRADLVRYVADLDEDAIMANVRARIANGEDPFNIVEDYREGLQIVGERYEKREYYLSGLIMAGEIFREVMHLLGPIIVKQNRGSELGIILLGTVAGDIHNIGKNILSMLLNSYGFTVHDLGVDVAPEEFLRKANELFPDIIALSGLLTSSFDSMRETVSLIRSQEGPIASIPIVVGGSTMDAEICKYIGADDWANDAMAGIRLFKKMLEEK